MISTPAELYDAILAFKSDVKSTICLLHKPCKNHPLCSAISSIEVLDFDAIEQEIATGRRSKRPSCDGVTLNKDKSVFCFLEIKGWQKFVEYNMPHDGVILSEENRQKIIAQAEGYNLKGKLEQSRKDCEEIAGQSDLFVSVPYVYVIVTDIIEEKDADKDIAANLSLLAGTASVWNLCDESMLQQMKKIDAAVRKVYTHCQDFDDCLSKIHL